MKYTITDLGPKSRKTFDAVGGSFTGARQAQMKVVKIEAVQ